MENFIYNTPTKVYFGSNSIENLRAELLNNRYNKVLFHYGKSAIKRMGLYDEVIKILNETNTDYVELGGVEPNPKISLVRDGVKLAHLNGVDFILAVGGGSVIDSAKSIACGVKTGLDPWVFSSHQAKPEGALPIGVILTISAAGSEMSNSCVITDETNNDKRGFNCEFVRPKFAIMDPTYTYTVSKYQTACGICDILMHTLERFVSKVEINNPLTDSIAIALIKNVIEYGKIAISNPNDYLARSVLMWASSLSHNGLTGCGRGYIMSVHQIEHALSGIFDEVAHGEGLSILWPNWSKLALNNAKERYAKLAYEILDVNKTINEYEAGLYFINYLQNYFKEIGLKTTLREYNIEEKDLEKIANLFSFNKTRTVKDVIDTDYNTCLEILKMAL